MNENKKGEEVVVTPTTEQVVTPKETPQDEPSQNILKDELNRLNSLEKKTPLSELDKALFTKKKIEQRIKELAGKETTDNDDGVKDEEEINDDTPVTFGALKKIEQQRSKGLALELASSKIQDQVELELYKFHLNNTIRPTGNPEEDFRLAGLLVNSVKNTQIVQELSRKPVTSNYSRGSGAPAKTQEVFEPTAEELIWMTKAKGFDGKPLLTEEDIKKSRKN